MMPERLNAHREAGGSAGGYELAPFGIAVQQRHQRASDRLLQQDLLVLMLQAAAIGFHAGPAQAPLAGAMHPPCMPDTLRPLQEHCGLTRLDERRVSQHMPRRMAALAGGSVAKGRRLQTHRRLCAWSRAPHRPRDEPENAPLK